MKYLVCKQFKGKGIDQDFNLKKGSTCNEIGGFIFHNEKMICSKTSMNAYQFFSRNDDGKGQERFTLVNEILNKIKDFVADYNEDRAAILSSDRTDEEKGADLEALESKATKAYNAIREYKPSFLRGDTEVLSFEFYNAEIEDLEKVLELI